MLNNNSSSFLKALAVFYLVGSAFFVWGWATARYEIFPWWLIYQIEAFVIGHPEDKTTVFEKIVNDLDIKPERLIRDYANSFDAKNEYVEIILEEKNIRRENPKAFIAPNHQNLRILIGAFDFEDAKWGAILIDGAGLIQHTWKLSGEIEGLNLENDVKKLLYGVAVFPDGSIVFNMEERGGGIVKRDFCSNLVWTSKGKYHHVIAPSEDFKFFWTFGGSQHEVYPKIVMLDSRDGKILKIIDMKEIEQRNPDIFIFDHRSENLETNYPHPNDIEPLPSAIAENFSKFNAGDLLINYHMTSLVFVLDPVSLEIKWWYAGAGDGAHDGDWQPNGTITLFNNKFRAGWDNKFNQSSSIVSINPDLNSHKNILDGKRYNLYSTSNGNHDMTNHGTALITSSTQGRFTEVNLENGKIIFDFINYYNVKKSETLHVSGAFEIDESFFKNVDFASCK